MLLGSIPSRAFTSSRPSDPLGPEPTPTRFVAPSTTSSGLAPCAAVRPPPPRFRSQGSSPSQRFPGTPGLCGRVSCRSRPWGSSLQSVAPRRGRVPLSGSHAPLQFPRRGPRAFGVRARSCLSGFHGRARTFVRVGPLPAGASRGVSAGRARTPVRLPLRAGPSPPSPTRGLTDPGLLRSLSPPTKPFHDRETVAVALLGFRPSRAFLRSSLGPSSPDGPFRPSCASSTRARDATPSPPG